MRAQPSPPCGGLAAAGRIKRSGVKGGGGGDQSAHRARQGTDEAEKTLAEKRGAWIWH